jgi:hypothetical protein
MNQRETLFDYTTRKVITMAFTVRTEEGFLGSKSKLERFDTLQAAVLRAVTHVENFSKVEGKRDYGQATIYFVNEAGTSEDQLAVVTFSVPYKETEPKLNVEFSIDAHLYATVFGSAPAPQPVQLTRREQMLAKLADMRSTKQLPST